MLVCSIDLWPRGDSTRAENIGCVVIANDGTGTVREGNYRCALTHSGRYRQRAGPWRGGRVTGHIRQLSPYHLVLKAIEACLKQGSTTEWSKRMLSAMRARGSRPPYRISAAEEMRDWLQGEEAQQAPEALVEDSKYARQAPDTPPLEQLLEAVDRFLETASATPAPSHRVEDHERCVAISDCVRILRHTYRGYLKSCEENPGNPAKK